MNTDNEKTENQPLDGEESDASTCSAWGRLEPIAKGLELHGYELSRGTGKDANGEEYNTFDIRRPDQPEWEGVWMGWDTNLDEDGDDDELHTLIALIHDAILAWKDYEKHFMPPAYRTEF
jgi:hypothetical protein